MSITLSGRRLALVALLLGMVIAVPVTVLATQTFLDVPPTNAFFNDIEAIAAKGVTTGCGGGNYCPTGFVTREQMAGFMNRLGALQAGKTPVVNADKVDGYNANGLVASGYATSTASLTLTDLDAPYLAMTITVPVDGYLVVTSSFTSYAVGCSSGCISYTRLYDVESTAEGRWANASLAGAYANQTNTSRFEVSAGVHHLQLLASRETGNGSVEGFWGEMTAIFVPFGETNAPLSVVGPVSAGPASPTKQ